MASRRHSVRLAEGSLVWAARRGREDELEHILEQYLPLEDAVSSSAPVASTLHHHHRHLQRHHSSSAPTSPHHRHRAPPPGINQQDSTGRTTASYLAGNGAADLLEILIQFPELDINLADNEGNTPLHFAAQAGQVDTVSVLLNQCPKLEIDIRNNLGFTPLMKAAIQGRTKCAKLLLAAGASPTLRDGGRGLRAEEWARFCGRHVTCEVIEKWARNRLLERGTSGGGGGGGGGRWGSDPELGPHLVNGLLRPPQSAPPPPQPKGLASRLRRALSRPHHHHHNQSQLAQYSLVTQITSAAFCASSPALPAGTSVPPLVRSLIRPLQVPKLQITTPTESGPPAYQQQNTSSPTKTKKKK